MVYGRIDRWGLSKGARMAEQGRTSATSHVGWVNKGLTQKERSPVKGARDRSQDEG